MAFELRGVVDQIHQDVVDNQDQNGRSVGSQISSYF